MMLLSRVADALYWISRYLERAEHTARVVDVGVDLGLGRALPERGAVVARLCGTLGLPHAAAAGADMAALTESAFFDAADRNSVMACVTSARENARQVREEISSEMWEQINEMYLRLRQIREDAGWWEGRTHYLARSITAGVHLFQGVTDATMGHGEGWQFLRAGRFLERAEATAALLDAFLRDTVATRDHPPLDQVEWVGLLRACAALEAYCRHYTADVRPERVADFLLLNAEFPRSVRFAAGSVESAVLAIATWSGRRSAGRVERLAGRLRASLDYGQVDEILGEGASAYLANIGRQCVLVHAALHQSYVTYPIDLALPA